MTFADHLNILEFVIAPVLICTAAISVPLLFMHKKMQATAPTGAPLFIVVFALLGAITGICTRASRQPVVGTILPAILTLMTAIFGYAFTRDSLVQMRP